MTEIVRPDGHVLTTVKQEHHPDRVKARRIEIEKKLIELINAFVDDMAPSEHGSSVPDEDAIFKHYDQRWRAQCIVAEKASIPVKCDPEAFANKIHAQREAHLRREAVLKPLATMKDHELEAFNLVSIGAASALGDVWLSDRFALVIYKDGIYLHQPDLIDSGLWLDYLLDRACSGDLHFTLKRTGYRMVDLIMHIRTMAVNPWLSPMPNDQHINLYMHALTVPPWSAPSPAERDAAMASLPQRRWWKPSTW